MTRSISWKVTVAYSSALVLLLLAQAGYTQPVREPALQQKITLHSDHLSAEAVLQRIEALTQIHFVYSSSLIELNKTLAVNFYERPLREVLDVIGKQLGLELKMQGSYVVLKKLAVPATYTPTSPPIASRLSRAVIMNEAPAPLYLPEPPMVYDSLITYRTLKRSLLRGKSDFGLDTAFLRHYLRQPVQSILKPATHSRWQITIALFANDYAAGTEVHAGLRSLYVVANTGYMRGGYFRNGFGAGSSLRIKPGVYLNPVYTYGRMTYEEKISPFHTLKIAAQHHQIKLQLSLAVTNHISFQIGPTFNVLKSHYTFNADGPRKIMIMRTNHLHGGNMGWTESSGVATPGELPTSSYAEMTGGTTAPFTTQVIDAPRFRRPEYEALKSWVGFETSISYSINFYRRP